MSEGLLLNPPAHALLPLPLSTTVVPSRCQLQVLLRLELARCFSSEQCDVDQMVEEVRSSFFIHTNTFCGHSNQPLDVLRWPIC